MERFETVEFEPAATSVRYEWQSALADVCPFKRMRDEVLRHAEKCAANCNRSDAGEWIVEDALVAKRE